MADIGVDPAILAQRYSYEDYKYLLKKLNAPEKVRIKEEKTGTCQGCTHQDYNEGLGRHCGLHSAYCVNTKSKPYHLPLSALPPFEQEAYKRELEARNAKGPEDTGVLGFLKTQR